MNSSKPVRLTTDGKLKQDPVFLTSGELVYTCLESPILMRLMRLPAGQTKPEFVSPSATTNEFEATYSADGSLCAFVQSQGNLNMKLIIRDVASGKQTVFDAGGGFSSLRHPSFHPKGDSICFAIPSANGQEIVTVGKDGKGRKTLTSGGINNWPAYSPDGKRIAFCSSRDGEFDLYVMSADGSEVKRILKLPGMQVRPCWSPDGTRLAFTWNREGKYEIHAVKLDGKDLTRLTVGFDRADYATWHPDGKTLAFVGEKAGEFDLYSVSLSY